MGTLEKVKTLRKRDFQFGATKNGKKAPFLKVFVKFYSG
tara:strand:+ start:296 stop:412 length:117 start_codon:yes stop_codon:yes gene_type:complete